jgi:hypothetical protein
LGHICITVLVWAAGKSLRVQFMIRPFSPLLKRYINMLHKKSCGLGRGEMDESSPF